MRALLTLKKYFLNYRKYLLLGLLFIVLSNVFSIVIPPIVREAVDGVVLILKQGEDLKYNPWIPSYFHTTQRIALFAGILIVASAILKGTFMYFMRMTIIVMSRHIEYDLKNDIFKQYQRLGQNFYSKNYTGDLMNRISDDVSKVRAFVGPAIMYTLNLSCMILMVVSLMLYVNVKITLFVLLPLPVLALTIYLVSDSMNRQSDRIQQKLSHITSFVQESFSGIHVLKSYAAEKDFSADFKSLNDRYMHDNMRLVRINGIFMPAVLGLVGMSILLTMFVGGKEVIAGNFSIGNIVEYVIYVNMLTWPVASIGYVTSLVQRAAASQARINEFLSEEVEESTGVKVFDRLKHSIEFRNVSFRYQNTDKDVLDNVSFTIPVNEKLGIIGTTGSGKSTLAKLLMGVYRPTRGQILWDGVPMDEYEASSLKKSVGYVSQDIFLFSDTIRNNIVFGCDEESDNDFLQQAVDTAQLQAEIDTFPKGMETILGERGITLSGGQKQRTAIARALIKNPGILLLDDALSAVDTKTEVAIKNGLAAWEGERTVVNISHRVSSIQDATQIILLDQGRIVESGDHQSLLLNDGMYADLYNRQIVQENEVS